MSGDEIWRALWRAMARFFWFPVEFGLMEPDEGLTVYGSGCSGIRFSSNGW